MACSGGESVSHADMAEGDSLSPVAALNNRGVIGGETRGRKGDCMADIPYQAKALRTRACRSESCDPPPAKIARRFDKLEFSLRPSVGERSICFSGSPP